MSIGQNEADAAELVQRFVNYFMSAGLANAGGDFLLLSVEQLAVDLCTYCDIFEETEPSVLHPYIRVWREVHVTEADMLKAASVRQHGEPID